MSKQEEGNERALQLEAASKQHGSTIHVVCMDRARARQFRFGHFLMNFYTYKMELVW